MDDSWKTWLEFVRLECRKDEIQAVNSKFLASSGDPRPYLRVSVLGIALVGLLDSGSSSTIVGGPGWEKLRSLNLQLQEHPDVSLADGSLRQVLGFIDLPLQLNSRIRVLKVLVVPSITTEILLGINFWKDMDIVPRVASNSYSLGVAAVQGSSGDTPQQREDVSKLVERFFTKMGSKLGCAKNVVHVIDVGDHSPIKQRYYPVSPYIQQQINAEVDKMLELGVIEPSKSPWSSPVVMVKKPNNEYRFCIDFRKVNQVSKRDAYPLPYVSTILDRLHSARVFSSIDIKSAYWQIPLAEESKEVTAFTVPGKGLFHFRRMPFGLHTAPATWQRFVDTTLGADLEPWAFIYLDDIIVATPDFATHSEVLRKVFERLVDAGLTVNREKCEFLKTELRYLGHIVDANGIRTDPHKIECMLNYPRPTNAKEVRRFVGLVSWYRRYVRNFSSLVAPLTRLTRKRCVFAWTPEAEEGFLALKECLVTAPILATPDFSRPFVLQCDASGQALGCVLSQDGSEGEQVIAYASRALTGAESKYSATELECLAVLFGIEKFRPYLEGVRFTVVTDHFSLLWLYKLQNPSGRLARWSLRLQGYDFEIVHRKGKSNVVPDALSRAINAVDVQPTDHDPWYTSLLQRIRADPQKYPRFCVRDEKIYRLVKGGSPSYCADDDWRLLVPPSLRKAVLVENHDSPTSGHLGYFKTQKRVSALYYWPKMNTYIARYVRNCEVCAAQKPEQRAPYGQMGHRTVSKPWELICTDIMGPFPLSRRRNRFILIVADCFTKYVLLFPLKSALGTVVSEHMENDVFLRFGVPSLIICDNGKQYVSNVFRKMVESYDCKITFNANYHPQANPSERINRVVKTAVRSYLTGDTHQDWDRNISKIAFAINTAVHEVTGYSPAYLNFGRSLFLSGKLHHKLTPPHPQDEIVCDSREKLNDHLKELFRLYVDVQKRLEKAYLDSASRYNLRRRPLVLDPGQIVWKRNRVLSNKGERFAAGLAPKFVKCVVHRKVTPGVYELLDYDTRVNLGAWHVQDLKLDRHEDF